MRDSRPGRESSLNALLPSMKPLIALWHVQTLKNPNLHRFGGRTAIGSVNLCWPERGNFFGRQNTKKFSAISALCWQAGVANCCSNLSFSLRAGLDELVYAQLMVIPAINGMGLDRTHYSDVWGTTLIEVDETLRTYEPVVRKIADKLMMTGKIDRWQLAKILASVEERKTPPPIRNGVEPEPPFDPLS